MRRLTFVSSCTYRMPYNRGTEVSIRTVDTDVVVLAITSANLLNISELWIAFGAGKSFRFIAAHEITTALGPDRCVVLPMLHAFTGCDTVSYSGGRGKKTTWDTWTTYMETSHQQSAHWVPCQTHVPLTSGWNRWIDLWSCCTIAPAQEDVNRARKQLFSKKGRTIDGLPPTQAVLI